MYTIPGRITHFPPCGKRNRGTTKRNDENQHREPEIRYTCSTETDRQTIWFIIDSNFFRRVVFVRLT